MNLPQISQIYTDTAYAIKICVNLRNLWENTFQASYECSPADLTDLHRCSIVTPNIKDSPTDLADLHRYSLCN